nr:uncharacterized protein I203_06851 [Kwoniella mangroviensis CBS 8507]OCF63898.1 hypothetical protein I203_06851 [Kwoniella mangroviensis CBS 8507]
MSYSYYHHPRVNPTYQQAFPPYNPQTQDRFPYPAQPGPSTVYQSGINNQSFYTPNSGHYHPSPRPTTDHKSKGYRYLESLSTSVSNLNINPTHNGYNPESRVRLHSDPISPNYNKRLPALPPPPPSNRYEEYPSMNDAGPSHQDLTPPPLPPRPISMPLPETHDDLPEPVTIYSVTKYNQRLDGPQSLGSNRDSASKSQKVSSPPKTFRPSVHPHSKPRLSDENRLRPLSPHTPPRPKSDSAIPTSSKKKGKGKATSFSTSTPKSKIKTPTRRKEGNNDPDWNPIIDLTISSSEDDSEEDRNETITPRSSARRKRAISEQPSRTSVHTSTPSKSGSNSESRTPGKDSTPGVVQCSGFTRTGQPCKRLVKVSAPYLSARDTNVEPGGDERSEKVMGRYCKDHAGMICQVDGFYWRGDSNKAGIWIEFKEFIPPDLGQQTQTLLRMTMESKLTAKETSGYLYAYELRGKSNPSLIQFSTDYDPIVDLETPSVAYFKVGRTDNVPRRIGEWTNQCQSKKPTLRDIFPLPPSKNVNSGLQRSGTLTTSFLPGATTHLNPPSKAMKRWERLVHLELSERSSSGSRESQTAFEKVREKCKDCGLSHREIFPIYKNGNQDRVYESIVMEVICRWDKFINHITEGVGAE